MNNNNFDNNNNNNIDDDEDETLQIKAPFVDLVADSPSSQQQDNDISGDASDYFLNSGLFLNTDLNYNEAIKSNDSIINNDNKNLINGERLVELKDYFTHSEFNFFY